MEIAYPYDNKNEQKNTNKMWYQALVTYYLWFVQSFLWSLLLIPTSCWSLWSAKHTWREVPCAEKPLFRKWTATWPAWRVTLLAQPSPPGNTTQLALPKRRLTVTMFLKKCRYTQSCTFYVVCFMLFYFFLRFLRIQSNSVAFHVRPPLKHRETLDTSQEAIL